MDYMKFLPRGIRNNNPLNIRISENNWKGKLPHSSDPCFEQFLGIFWGIRAAMVCVRTYIRKYHLNTPEKIIARWAPASENNVEAYVQKACKKGALKPDEKISYENKNQFCRLLWGMAFVECGQTIDFHYFESAYNLSKS